MPFPIPLKDVIGYKLRDTGGYFNIEVYSEKDSEVIGSASKDWALFLLAAIREHHMRQMQDTEKSAINSESPAPTEA